MANDSGNPGDVKMLPGGTGFGGTGSGGTDPAAASLAQPAAVPQLPADVVPSTSPGRQLSELPLDELANLAGEYGLDPTAYKSRQHLVAAIHDRRQLIAAMDREAMLDTVRWARRPVPLSASKELLALEIVRCRSMRFAGLSHRGLFVLARLRGVDIRGTEPIPELVKKLRRQEGLFSKLGRKRRAMVGAMVSRMLGTDDEPADYAFLPPPPGTSGTTAGNAPRPSTIKEDIEESGLLGGIANRVKKSADSYVNQKLDEIEARIDRKLDEIDRRLAEWRDKEIANRIRILKITLWASVIVGAFSLIYSYVQTYIVDPKPAAQSIQQSPPR